MANKSMIAVGVVLVGALALYLVTRKPAPLEEIPPEFTPAPIAELPEFGPAPMAYMPEFIPAPLAGLPEFNTTRSF